MTTPFGGRTEVVLNCIDAAWGASSTFSAAWYTGPIAGHPYEAELLAAGINTVPGNSNYAWGKVGNTSHDVMNMVWWGCIRDPQDVNAILAARQAGSTVTLYIYRKDNVSDCQVNFIKTKP